MPSPSESGIYCLVRSKEVEDIVRSVPGSVNAALNRETRAIGGEFGRRFASRLGPGGIRIRRTARRGGRGAGQPFLPAKVQAAGFKSNLSGFEKIDGKRLRIGTRSPVMLSHELGLTIKAKSKLGMAIPFSKGSKPSLDERREAIAMRRGRHVVIFSGGERTGRMKGPLLPGGQFTLRGLAFYEKTVRMNARLGFLRTWDAYVPEALSRLDRSLLDVIHRYNQPSPLASAGYTAGVYGWVRDWSSPR